MVRHVFACVQPLVNQSKLTIDMGKPDKKKLILAIWNENLDQVKEHKAAAKSASQVNYSELFAVIGDAALLSFLGVDYFMAKNSHANANNFRTSILHLAASMGNLPIVQELKQLCAWIKV